MENNPYYRLINEIKIYPEEVVNNWGMKDPFWSTSAWHKRELSLRHDFVCILLCNLEEYNPLATLEQVQEFESAAKRMRTSEYGESSQSASSHSASSSIVSAPADLIRGSIYDENKHRYLLIEGMPGEERWISNLAHKHGVAHPGHSYDIFDQKMKRWIEVKVTRNYREAKDLYESTINPQSTTGLIHINPDTAVVTRHNMNYHLPGEGKAVDFILMRKGALHSIIEGNESELLEEEDMNFKIFPCERLNASVKKWEASFWDRRAAKEVDRNIQFPEDFKNKPFEYRLMAEAIEDTTLREAPMMKFKAKILPPYISDGYLTEKELDADLVTEFFEKHVVIGDSPQSELYNRIKGIWETGEKKTFCLIQRGKCEREHLVLADALGIGRKASIRDDGNPNLRQEDFGPIEKAKYSPWMEELMIKLSKVHAHGNTVSYAADLATIEIKSSHPMGKEMQKIRSIYFNLFGQSKIGEYCSRVKGVYSRLGGAYLERGQKGTHNSITVFPIVSSGTRRDGSRVRVVSGICVRGSHHAKKSTDRIALLTFELLTPGDVGNRFQHVVKKGYVLNCSDGARIIYRQNSILKNDPCFLAYVQNATYLAGNFLGEIVMRSTTTMRTHSSYNSAFDIMGNCGNWLMERVVESVLMAVCGGSQEEGAFAIIRKIFMAMVAKRGGDTPYNRDWPGLGESLNECLSDSALALYWAHQIRNALLVLDSRQA